MRLNDKEQAFQNLTEAAQEQSANIAIADRLAGTFSQAIFQALQVGLLHDEMIAALTVGHYLGSKNESSSPDYSFLFAQLDYWEAVFAEADQFWLQRYRGEEE